MNASVGVNPIAPRFLAGVKIDGITQWSPCNYCLWPNPSAEEWAKHLNQYHFPFAGNVRDQPIKWVWAVREVKDLEHPMDSYFIVESVPKTEAKLVKGAKATLTIKAKDGSQRVIGPFTAASYTASKDERSYWCLDCKREHVGACPKPKKKQRPRTGADLVEEVRVPKDSKR